MSEAKNTVVVMPAHFSTYPVKARCNNCQKDVITKVKPVEGTCFWLGVILGLICLWPICGCLWPLCSDCYWDTEHRCPECNMYLGSDKKIGK